MSSNPHPNATAAGLTGAIVTLALYIGTVLGWDPPPEVAAAIVTVVAAAVLVFPGKKAKPKPRQPTKLRKDRAAPHSTR